MSQQSQTKRETRNWIRLTLEDFGFEPTDELLDVLERGILEHEAYLQAKITLERVRELINADSIIRRLLELQGDKPDEQIADSTEHH